VVTRLTAESPVKRVCQVLDYLRSSYGGPSKGRVEQLRREAIAGVAAAWPPDGYRRLTAQLRRAGWRVKMS
jgi:transposase InsO family protein